MPSTTTTLEHPTLGTLHGNAYGNVTQFLSLRYATLEHRFAAPVVADRLPSGDCTVYGSALPSLRMVICMLLLTGWIVGCN